MYDAVIIGGGIVGCSIARELSRYRIKVVLLEKDSDVANGTTKANSAIIHSGYDAKPGTLKAKLNALGNTKFDKLCKELNVPFKRNGSLTVATDDSEVETLKELYKQGQINKIPELYLLEKDELMSLEPKLNDNLKGALLAKTAGIIDPFGLAIALAENAVSNGVEIKLESKVVDITKLADGYRVVTEKEQLETRYVINCAGLYAKEINDLVSPAKFNIKPRKGEYIVFDKNAGDLVKHVIFQCPSAKGKGVLVTPTAHGNLLIGPNAEDIDDKQDLATTTAGLNQISSVAKKSVKEIPMKLAITNFCGLRAVPDTKDFIIEELKECKGFINVAGIESPGLTASPAIAEYVIEILKQSGAELKENSDFNPYRNGFARFIELDQNQQKAMIAKDCRYGRIICRCENITEGEIVDSIHRSPGARTLDGVKRRVRPGMGRCQGGFCGPRVIEILARELKKDPCQIIKNNQGSYVLTTETKIGG